MHSWWWLPHLHLHLNGDGVIFSLASSATSSRGWWLQIFHKRCCHGQWWATSAGTRKNNKPLCIWITLRNIFLIILYANVVVLPVKQGSATPWGLQLCMKNSNKYNQNWEFILISLITIEKCWPILTWKSGNFHLANSSKYSPFEQNVCQFLARNQRANNKWRAHWSQSVRIDSKKIQIWSKFWLLMKWWIYLADCTSAGFLRQPREDKKKWR